MIEPPYIPIGFSLGWLEDHEQLTLSAVCGHCSLLTIGRLRLVVVEVLFGPIPSDIDPGG